MSTTLSYLGTTVTLPDDMLWIDQHNWSPVEQTVSTSITGASIIDLGTRVNGRGITLVSDDAHAWMTYADVTQLKTWAAIAGCVMSLSIQGISFTVAFRHHDKPAIDVSPIVDYNAPDAQDFFFGTLKFMEL